jgi:hypothetical protein
MNRFVPWTWIWAIPRAAWDMVNYAFDDVPTAKKERKTLVAISPRAGKPAPKEMLIDPDRLEREYFERSLDLGDPNHLVSFGTHKARLGKPSPEAVKESRLAGEPITAKLTRAPGNNATIGGLKVVSGSGWFAARPTGTENVYKIFAESFKDQSHLDAMVSEAQRIVYNALNSSGTGLRSR